MRNANYALDNEHGLCYLCVGYYDACGEILTTNCRLRWAENFLCAGSSALLISIPHVWPGLWFFALFALVPFLWRVTRVNLKESLALGGLLAASYAFVVFSADFWGFSNSNLLTLAGLIVLFALYSAFVSTVKKHLGFNAIFIAALWLPIEYVISHFSGLGYLFSIAPDESGLMYRLGSLFGLLMVSFVVVIVNALIVTTIGRLVRALRSRDAHAIAVRSLVIAPFEKLLIKRSWYCFPDVRAPPLHSSGF